MKAKSAVVSELRGSLQRGKNSKGITARTSKKSGIVISAKSKPTDARTPAQDAVRLEYKAGCDYWATIGDTERSHFVLIAKERRITVFNAFISHWLNPTVRTCNVTRDSFIAEDTPTANYGTNINLNLQDYSGFKRMSVLDFDIPDMNDVGFIKSAYLHLYANESYVTPLPGKFLRPSPVPTQWNESTITWNNAPNLDPNYPATELTENPPCWYIIDVTGDMKLWRQYPDNYFGLGIFFWPTVDANHSYLNIRSSEYADPDYKPYMILTYS